MTRRSALKKPHVSTEQIISLYRSGKTSYEIADIVGLAQPTVVWRLKRANIPRRTRWQQFARIPIEKAMELYRSGLNGCQVARMAGVTPAAIRHRLKQAGITIRPHKGTPRIGADNHAWKGGRSVSNGYVMVAIIGKKQRRPEHRLVMERILSRPLKKAEIVHHLNGIRDDNRPENLVATTLKDHEHYTYVKALQARIRQLEALIQKKT
jgi:DNA-binding CsgD family transcriptional regulator